MILAVSLASVIAASMVGIQLVNAFMSGAPAYVVANTGSAVAQNGNMVKLSVTANAPIQRFASDPYYQSQAVVGFGWANLDTGKAFVTTIHPAIGRDSNQNPSAWHAHTASLTPIGTVPDDGFCLKSIDSTPEAGIQIQGSTMNVNARASDVPFNPQTVTNLAVVGFTVVSHPGCGPVANTPFNDLAVQVNTP